MSKVIVLDPAAQRAQLLPASVIEHMDLPGQTVLPVADDFSWQGQSVDWATLTVVPDLSTMKAAKQADISAAFITATLAGCSTPWGRVDCDEVAQGRIDRLVKLLETMPSLGLDVPPVISFTRFDRSQVPLAPAELVQLGVMVGLHFLTLFQIKQALETSLAQASDPAAIVAIDATAGWPG